MTLPGQRHRPEPTVHGSKSESVSKLTPDSGVSPHGDVWNALEEFAVGVGSVGQPGEMFSQHR